ncbi:hypothetical protein OAS39_08830 [Pirellulales bacterium]|nr:hypothetical protein [Pirellulales bacterium]
MNLLDLAGYFIGRRQSIERIALCHWSLLVGGVFVLSAGFAREYDGEDLSQEPWHVLLPLAASLTTSLVLYGVLFLAVRQHATSAIKPLSMYRSFLSLYWMTAPLAWVYAIPVEQITTSGQAMRINLGLLGLVSLWRVLLITRGASVLFGASFRSMFVLVMLFADALALVILWFTPLPVFNIMGGIRLTESEAIIQDTAFTVGFIGIISLPIWLVTSLVVVGSKNRSWEAAKGDGKPVSLGVWAVATLSVLVWSVVLPYTQPPLHLAWKVENELENGRIENALELMSANGRESFPSHWDPPPWPGYDQDNPRLLDVLDVLGESPPTEWVRDIYVEKLLQQIGVGHAAFYFLGYLEQEDFERYLKVLERTPETHDAIRKNVHAFTWLMEIDSASSDERERQIREFLASVGVEVPNQLEEPEGASSTDSVTE